MLADGERNEPSANCQPYMGLKEVQPLLLFDLFEAASVDGCVLQVRFAHQQLSIIGRLRRPCFSGFIFRCGWRGFLMLKSSGGERRVIIFRPGVLLLRRVD